MRSIERRSEGERGGYALSCADLLATSAPLAPAPSSLAVKLKLGPFIIILLLLLIIIIIGTRTADCARGPSAAVIVLSAVVSQRRIIFRWTRTGFIAEPRARPRPRPPARTSTHTPRLHFCTFV